MLDADKEFVVFDIEATGLDVDTVDVHCIAVNHLSYPEEGPSLYDPNELVEGVDRLNKLTAAGTFLVGHNIIEYDEPLLRRYGLDLPEHQMYDTLVVSRAAYPGKSLLKKDIVFLKKNPSLRGQLMPGAHSLKAWGLRLGFPKDDYEGGWDEYSQEMGDYCKQDTVPTAALFDLLMTRIPLEAALLECRVASICRRMRLRGAPFNVAKGQELASELAAKRASIAIEVRGSFPDWVVPNGLATPKRTQNRKHMELIDGKAVEVPRMEKGVQYTKVKEVQFNPASGDHIARCFMHHYGWKPKEMTPGGKPKVTVDILRDLPYKEAAALADYQEIKKILGYLSEGNNSWLNLERGGRLHGKVNPTGTVSTRAAHSKPNLGNVPTRSELGHKCRELFEAPEGRVIVGADASGLQLRGLAEYLSRWDGGIFARQCEDGDIHEYMREATGLYVRDHQKTWTYAKLFGAFPTRLGLTVIDDHRAALAAGLTDKPVPKLSQAKALGEKTTKNLGNAIPAFDRLAEKLAKKANLGKLQALDGRWIPIASEHVALSMLLQSFEAVIMKQAMVFADQWLGDVLDAHQVLWVHDEFQVEANPDEAEQIGYIMSLAITRAGKHFNLNVRIDADYKVGKNWAETH